MVFLVVLSFIVLGCVVGFLSGLLGIGGGLVIVPALVYLLPLLDISSNHIMPIALATSLASIVVTSASAAYAHHRNGNIPWQITKQIMISVAIGASLGALIADSLSPQILVYIFSSAVILLASYMLASIRIEKSRGMPKLFVLQFIGIFVGIIASLMGISGGAILIPTLTYFGMSVRHSIGVATICGMMVALFGSIGYIITGLNQPYLPSWCVGYVYIPALVGIILTSSYFAPKGVKAAANLPVSTLKKFFSVFLIVVAIEMLLQ